jgi:hypothetical protein
MATVVQLDRRGELFKLDPALDDDQQEFRVLYASPRLKKWVEDVLPGLGSAWNIEVSPTEQLDALMEIYSSGETLTFQHNFYPLAHVANCVWELKTADLRIFGWFTARDCFVGVVADTTERVKLHGLYHGYAGEVVRFLEKLDLDEPKFIPGDDPNAVVSNFCYP